MQRARYTFYDQLETSICSVLYEIRITFTVLHN